MICKDAVEFLALSAIELPQFGDYNWHVHVAVVTGHDSDDAASRALLVLKREMQASESHSIWEFLKGTVGHTDNDVEHTIRRVVKKKAGLTISQILGSLCPVIVLDGKASKHRRIQLFFVVTVAEVSAIAIGWSSQVRPAFEYSNHRWLFTKDDIDTLQPVAPKHQALLTAAFVFRVETWQNTFSYLAKAPSELAYTDRYRYILSAAVVRPEKADAEPDASPTAPSDGDVGESPSAIFLIQRGPSKYGAGKWELPGGKIDPNAATLEEALRNKILSETGLRVDKIAGWVHLKPTVIRPPQDRHDGLGLVVLSYLVTVHEDKEDEGVKLDEDYTDWRWVSTAEEALKLPMSMAGLNSVKAALETANNMTD